MNPILGFIVISLSLFLFGCQGDEGQPVDYGPAVPQSSVDNALNAPLADVDPLKIQLGQFTDIIQSQILEGEAYQTTGEVGSTVVGRDDQPTQVVFTILEKTVSYSDNKVISRELTRTAQKNSADPTPTPTPAPTATPSPTPSPPPSITEASRATHRYRRLHSHWSLDVFSQNRSNPFVNSMILFMNKFMSVLDDAPAPTVVMTFHNLITANSVEAPPLAVQQQANCGGIPNCKIKVSKVAFDMLVWNNPTTPDKIHREFAISGDVPFFANVMSQCDSLLVPVGKIKTFVTLCSDVTNFRFTTPQ